MADDYENGNHIIIYLHPEFIIKDEDDETEDVYVIDYSPDNRFSEELDQMYDSIDIYRNNDKIHFYKKCCNSVIGIVMDVHEDDKNVIPVNIESLQLLQNLLETFHKRMDPRSLRIGVGKNCCS